MKIVSNFFRSGAFGVAALLFVVSRGELSAQAPAEVSPPEKTPTPEELNPAELLKSYLQVREELRTTQQAIVNNRLQTEATASAQAAIIAEKLEALKATMQAERERQRLELQRSNEEHDKQQLELQSSNRTLLWLAAIFGGVGLVGMLITPLFQWRAMNRMAELTVARPQLSPVAGPALLAAAGAASDETVAHSNQRLLTAIDRMERRISDFEHGWAHPASAPALTPLVINEPESTRRPVPVANDQSARINVLLAKGQSLFDMGKAIEAMACYNEILKLDINHPEALVRRGAALEKLKQDDEAIQCYDRAIKADRKMTLAYLYKGGVCNRLERYEEAVKCYEQALRVEEEEREASHA